MESMLTDTMDNDPGLHPRMNVPREADPELSVIRDIVRTIDIDPSLLTFNKPEGDAENIAFGVPANNWLVPVIPMQASYHFYVLVKHVREGNLIRPILLSPYNSSTKENEIWRRRKTTQRPEIVESVMAKGQASTAQWESPELQRCRITADAAERERARFRYSDIQPKTPPGDMLAGPPPTKGWVGETVRADGESPTSS